MKKECEGCSSAKTSNKLEKKEEIFTFNSLSAVIHLTLLTS